MNRWTSLTAALLSAAVLGGCASRVPLDSERARYPAPHASYERYGMVRSIETVPAESATSGAGALAGGVIGAVVGRQIGSGSGRTAGTLVGAVGGAIIGNQVEKSRNGTQDHVRVEVQLNDGTLRRFDYAQIGDLRVGDRVRVEGDRLYRL